MAAASCALCSSSVIQRRMLRPRAAPPAAAAATRWHLGGASGGSRGLAAGRALPVTSIPSRSVAAAASGEGGGAPAEDQPRRLVAVRTRADSLLPPSVPCPSPFDKGRREGLLLPFSRLPRTPPSFLAGSLGAPGGPPSRAHKAAPPLSPPPPPRLPPHGPLPRRVLLDSSPS